MKLKNLFYLLLAMPLAFAACNETPDVPPTPDPEPSFTLTSDATMEFEAQGGEGTITFVYDFTDVNEAMVDIECAADWIEVADQIQASAASFTFTVAENDDEEAREAVVRATIGNLYFEVTVKQEGKKETPKTPVFELVSEEVMELSQEQQFGTIKFNLENPVAGVTVSVKSNQSWVNNFNVREADGEIAFVVDANNGAAREAKITATYGMLEFKVTVKQAEYVAPAPEIIIDSASKQFEAAGGNGEITFHVNNTVEGVEATAASNVEWISVTSCANGVVAYTVAANESSTMRSGVITLTYGEVSLDVTIEQLFEGYNPNLNYSTFVVIETWADLKQEGKQWNVTFVEHDALLGDMQTTISFYNAEANIQHLSSGSYSVANGGILVNSASQNGFSVYRGNSSLATDIVDATFEVVADTDNHTISIIGTFQSGNDIIALSYNDAIRGMDISEPTTEAINITDWKQFTGKYWNGSHDDSEFMFQGRSSDNAVEFMFDCYAYPRVSDKIAPEGEYTIAPWEAKDNYQGDTLIIMDQSYIIYNTIKGYLAEGTLTVTHMRGQYYIEFDFIDTLGRHFTGSYTGQLTTGSTMNNPA